MSSRARWSRRLRNPRRTVAGALKRVGVIRNGPSAPRQIEPVRSVAPPAEADRGDPTEVESLRRSIRSLNQRRRHEEALQQLRAASDVPERVALSLEAEIHEAAHRNDLAVELRKRICEATPLSAASRLGLVKTLTRAGRMEEAAVEISALEEFAPWEAVRARIEVANAEFRYVDGLELVEQAIELDPDKRQNTQLLALQLQRAVRSGDPGARERSRELLSDESLPDLPMHFIRLALSIDWPERAAEIAARSATGQASPSLARYHAFERHQAGDVEGARKIWSEIRAEQVLPTTREPRPGELVRLDDRPLDPFGAEIRLFTVVRDELPRLPWFLDYYRALGVDRFVFIDNDSIDGTRQFLGEQADVHLFHTTTPYTEGMAGMVWVNALGRDLCREGWLLYVDVDEALVYSDVEKHKLRGLTSYMDRRGHEAAAGQMVDMFSLDRPDHGGDEGPVDFVARYRHFDYAYDRYPHLECPYFFTSGGIRSLNGFSSNCTKTPLIRAGRDIAFLGSSHMITPAVISDVDIALLHYKYTHDVADELEAEARRHRPTMCQNRYRVYEKLFAEGGFDALIEGRSTVARYESSHTLRSAGLLAPLPADFA